MAFRVHKQLAWVRQRYQGRKQQTSIGRGGFSLGFEGRVLLLSQAGVELLGVLKDYYLLMLRLWDGAGVVLMPSLAVLN